MSEQPPQSQQYGQQVQAQGVSPELIAEQQAAAAEGFNMLFSTRRPKDAAAGVSSGLKSVVKGVLAGAASLVAAPVLGAQQEGLKVRDTALTYNTYPIERCRMRSVETQPLVRQRTCNSCHL